MNRSTTAGTDTAGGSPRAKARAAGWAYLVCALTALFAHGYVRAGLITPGDQAATAREILDHETLFRASIAADAVAVVAYVVVITLLFDLLKPAGRALAATAAALGLVASAVMAANLLHQVSALLVLTGGADPDRAYAEMQRLLALHAYGYSTFAAVFFGFYQLMNGVLMFISGFFPRWIGILLAFTGLNSIYLLAQFVAPGFDSEARVVTTAILAPGHLAEPALLLWLLIVGVNASAWHAAKDRSLGCGAVGAA